MRRGKRGMFFVAVIVFLTLLSGAGRAEDGCYLYPHDEELYCQQIDRTAAQADCDRFSACNMDEQFIPNTDCSGHAAECQEIRCDVDCQMHARGWCEQLGLDLQGPAGQEILDEDFDVLCNGGCCRIEGIFCQGVYTEWDCRLQALVAGSSSSQTTYIPGQGSLEQCQNGLLCQTTIETASLTGTITSSSQPVPAANIALEGRTAAPSFDPTTGVYSFLNLPAGIYQVVITAVGYNPLRATISLSPGQDLTRDFVLQAATATTTISGTVTATFADGLTIGPVPSATVSWGSGRQVLTDDTGHYEITDLAAGVYTITASKAGFTASSISETVFAGQPVSDADIMITELPFQGVRGFTYIDRNGNGIADDTEREGGARLYVDGVYRSTSFYSLGEFSLSLSVTPENGGRHEIFATYNDVDELFETLEPVEVTIRPAQTTNIGRLLLSPLQPDCATDADYNVQEFTLSHIPGEKAVDLHWVKPCAEVREYQITRQEGSLPARLLPRLFSFREASYTDQDVEWGKTYTYQIVALNARGEPSPQPNVQQITLGNEQCAGHYIQDPAEEAGIWESFCLMDQRQKVFTCDDQNNYEPYTYDCLSGQFCARIAPLQAGCKDAGVCSFPEADPFGLFATADMCYGTPAPSNGGAVNFCYFESTNSTINQCLSCTQIGSCFGYKDKNACITNSCLTSDCQWVDSAQYASADLLVDYGFIGLTIPGFSIPAGFTTPETGTGYCVEQNYGAGKASGYDLECSRCSSGGELYENYYCTADVCSNLGRCLSEPASSRGEFLASCLSCGNQASPKINCYAYQTEKECTSGDSTILINGDISLSNDSCSWGRCGWTGSSCIKDGDGDSLDDCQSFIGSKLESCVQDNNAPGTQVEPAEFTRITTSSSLLTFHATDNSNLGILGFCLANVEDIDCIPQEIDELHYPGRFHDEHITINITDAIHGGVNGQTFKLRYYSEDEFSNRESIKEQILFIDNVPPEFEINGTITTIQDQSDLTIFLTGIHEPLSCDFILTPTLPRGAAQAPVVIGREQQDKRVTFSDLTAAGVKVDVTCTDDNGNQEHKQSSYIFDLAQDIDVIYPPIRGAIAKTRIAFKVETAIPATCELYDEHNQKMADFVADETGKVHETVEIPGFVEREYAGEQQVVCYDALTGAPFDNPDYFQFQVDFTPPATQIVLAEGAREVRPWQAGWKEFFVQTVSVNFECRADGFACDKTFYCLGTGCEDITNPGFKEYEQETIVTESTRLCYYSTDTGNTRVYNPVCGDIRVEGFGITLQQPALRYYQNEMWGVSNTPEFTWQFFTRVPTVECKFDFTPSFDYDSQPAYKIRTPDSIGLYTFADFPRSVFSSYPSSGSTKVVYVQCKDGQDLIGPEQKMLLEYDPSAPAIDSAYADPDPVVEGITTNLFVNTDDKTICRYSDNSTGSGSSEFSTMEFYFPGALESIMGLAHEDLFAISFLGPTKTYNLNVQCENGAGDFSSVEQLSFFVDYSSIGNIISISPDGQSFNTPEVQLQVETSKNAFCEYELNDVYDLFAGAGTRLHTVELRSLQEGSYTVPVRCTMGDQEAQTEIHFMIDLTAPRIISVNDGNYSCGSDIAVFVTINETNSASYSYELYDKGITNSTIRSTVNDLVASGSVSGDQSLLIAASTLQENHKYAVKVTPTDNAGNSGTAAESDGFTVVPANSTICTSVNLTGPEVNVVIDDLACDSVSLQMDCLDSLSCKKLLYNTNPTSTACNATKPYGTSVTLTRTEFLCYYVENAVGKNYTSQQKIIFLDEDGDGIKNSCDKCEKTVPGKVVNGLGCSDTQVTPSLPNGTITNPGESMDVDNDGLPDQWERTFNSLNCALDPLSDDSNANGIPDNIEDYDGDGRTNYLEYKSQTDPCKDDTARPTITTPPPGANGSTAGTTESNLAAWILLLIGLLMMGGGIGYLVYYYNQPKSAVTAALVPLQETISNVAENVAESFRKISPFQKSRLERQKKRQREELFSSFTKKSSEIPHVGEMLNKTSTALPHLQRVAEKYTEHKEQINPGLRPEEKSAFAQLENIAQQTKNKPIDKVVSKEEAQDLFSKLKNLKKRREQ